MAGLRHNTAALGDIARMQIDSHQGQVMQFLLRLIGARRVLEIGTFTGMSALWMAQAADELHCCDINGEWTAIAQQAWHDAGLAEKITLHLGPALETLPQFADGFFDAVFVDADKRNYPAYVDAAHRLLRTGGLLMLDNTLWHGEVANPQTDDKWAAMMRDFNAQMAADGRFLSCILPIGDGLTVAVKG
jgi:predicted O-methyltransferase YrrM